VPLTPAPITVKNARSRKAVSVIGVDIGFGDGIALLTRTMTRPASVRLDPHASEIATKSNPEQQQKV